MPSELLYISEWNLLTKFKLVLYKCCTNTAEDIQHGFALVKIFLKQYIPPRLSVTFTQISLLSGHFSPKNPIPRQLNSSPQPGVAEVQR